MKTKAGDPYLATGDADVIAVSLSIGAGPGGSPMYQSLMRMLPKDFDMMEKSPFRGVPAYWCQRDGCIELSPLPSDEFLVVARNRNGEDVDKILPPIPVNNIQTIKSLFDKTHADQQRMLTGKRPAVMDFSRAPRGRIVQDDN